MVEPLSAADRSSLITERRPINMAIGAVIILERGPGVTYEALCRRISERLHLLPRYRQRLVQPALGITNPVWTDDEHFDVAWHVRLARLPEPGGQAALAAYVGREFSRLLDRSRPLWELHLVEGLPDDRVALVAKMHHALVDGLAAVGIGMVLMDLGPEPVPVDAPAHEWRPRPYAMRRHLSRLAASPVTRAQRVLLDGTSRLLDTSPRSAASDLKRASEIVLQIARTRSQAPALPLNRRISPNRDYAFGSVPLDDVKAVRKALGGTVNDVLLGAVSGMLAGYLRECHVAPERLVRDPVALVPVSIRGEGEESAGNRVSVVFVDLPVGEPDPAKRLALIADRMTRIKGSARVAAGSFLADMTGFAPPLLSSALASVLGRASGDSPAFNLVVSNVPGPQMPLWINGSRVLALYPVVPLNPADQTLNVGMVSFDGSVFFGISGDRSLEPPVSRALAALEESFAELRALAG
jgi:diacylglycerol O-acyltransferase